MENRAHVSERENAESQRGCEVYIKEEIDPELEINAADYVNVSIRSEVEENFEPNSLSASPPYKHEREKYKNNEITESGVSKIGKKKRQRDRQQTMTSTSKFPESTRSSRKFRRRPSDRPDPVTFVSRNVTTSLERRTKLRSAGLSTRWNVCARFTKREQITRIGSTRSAWNTRWHFSNKRDCVTNVPNSFSRRRTPKSWFVPNTPES